MSAAEAIGWVELSVLAREVLGSTAKNLGRAGRDWCKARGVPYKRDGKFNLVRLADVRRAIESIGAAESAESSRAEAVNDAVAKLQRAG